MALKIRMRQQGRTNRAFYRVVLTDTRSPRDGKYLEVLGWYNPFETSEDKEFSLDGERIRHWISLGAEITESVQALVNRSQPSVVAFQKERALIQRNKAKQKRVRRKEKAAAKA